MSAEKCCVCSSADVAYRNYLDLPFCDPCANGKGANAPKPEASAEGYERLSPQQCPKGLHANWAVDSENAHACPWCRIAELEAAAAHNDLFRSCGCPKRFERHAWRCPTLPAAYDPVPQQRQAESPVVELPSVPHQRGES